MSPALRYGATSVAVIGLATLALWPFLAPAAREGVLAAAAVALPVQVAAFAVLVRTRGKTTGFMAAWVGGMAVRAAVVTAAAFIALRWSAESAVPLLLALAGFFFALVLLEPLYFRAQPKEGVS